MSNNVSVSLTCLLLVTVIGCGEDQERSTQTRTDSMQAAPAKISTMQRRQEADQLLVAFGQGGQIKMLYDRRQRPQSVYLDDKVHIVFNAGGQIGARPNPHFSQL